MKPLSLFIYFIIIVFLTACSDLSDDDDESTDGEVNRISFTGLVADGYLVDATVCLDLNDNKECDSDEPSTTSVAGGGFTITEATQAQFDAHALIVQIVKGVTVDEDSPGTALTKSLTLSAPAGFNFISPLSTMVQNEVEKGADLDSAKSKVQSKLGTDLDLNTDYVAAKSDASLTADQRTQFEQLHQVAQVTATVISNNMDALEDAAVGANISLDDLISTIVGQVFDALAEIATQVELIAADSTQTFDVDALATDIDDDYVDLDSTNLAEEVAQTQAEQNASAANLAAIVNGDGLFWFYSELEVSSYFIEYGNIYIASGVGQEDFFEWNGSAFITGSTGGSDYTEHVLTASGWMVTNDEIVDITANADNTVTLEFDNFEETISASQLDLAGLSVSTVMEGSEGDGIWADAVPSANVFPSGALGFDIEFVSGEGNFWYEKKNTCDAGEKVNDICNVVRLFNGSGTTNAITFSAVTVSSAYTPTGSDQTDADNLTAVELGYKGSPSNTVLMAEIVQDGSINFYEVRDDNAATSIFNFRGTGTWTSKTVGGQLLYELDGPDFSGEFDGRFDVTSNTILFELSGGLREGEHDLDEAGDLLFNKTAADHILDVFDFSLLPTP